MRRCMLFLIALGLIVGIGHAPSAAAEKGKNLRLISVFEKTTEDPNLLVQIFQDDDVGRASSARGPNARKALIVAVADLVEYGRALIFSGQKRMIIVASNMDEGMDGLVLHEEDGNAKTIEYRFDLDGFDPPEQIPENEVTRAQVGAIGQIKMIPNPTDPDLAEALILLNRALIIPPDPTATAGNSQNVLTWGTVEPDSGPTKYNVYWATTPGVTQETGTKIADVGDPSFTHTGLISGTTYFYVITSERDPGTGVQIESLDSVEVSATPAH